MKNKTCQAPPKNAENVKRMRTYSRGEHRPESSENIQGEKHLRSPKNHEKRESGDAKISYPRLRLEINLRYAGPPAQTRQLSVLADTKNLVQLPLEPCNALEKEEA